MKTLVSPFIFGPKSLETFLLFSSVGSLKALKSKAHSAHEGWPWKRHCELARNTGIVHKLIDKMADGVKKEVIKPGNGRTPHRGATITVNCTGSLNTNPPKKFWRYFFLI